MQKKYNYAELNDILNRSVDYLEKNATRLALRPGELEKMRGLCNGLNMLVCNFRINLISII